MSAYNSYNSYKPKRDYHSNKERSYHGHHNNHHPHPSYKRYNSGGGSGAGGNGTCGGNGSGTGMGMSGSSANSNHYYPSPYHRQYSGHSHSGGHQESRSHHHHYQHHHHHPTSHHQSQHHQNQHHYPHQQQHQQQRTTSPQQRSQTPNIQHYRQQSPSQSQVSTSGSNNDISTTQKLWNAGNMEEVATYLEGLYIEAERQDERLRRPGNVSHDAGVRRSRPHSLVVESSNTDSAPGVGPHVASPKQPVHPNSYRGDQRLSGGQMSTGGSYSMGPPMNCIIHPTNGGGQVGDYVSGSRGGSSSSSHEQGENGFGYSRRFYRR